MKTMLAALVSCLLSFPVTAQDVSAQLARFMDEQVKMHHFSGVVLVVRDGRRLLAKGYGSANLEWDVPNTLTTRFRIASLTKTFTAAAIMQLRENGKLDVQDSLCKYFDPCPAAWKPVTLHHLLSHTSGVPAYGGKPETHAGEFPPWSEAEITSWFADRPLEFEPGSRWKYSDWGYSLLGFVIEKVTGKSYEEVLQQQIFTPLRMRDSGYDHPRAVMKRRAAGYRLDGERMLNAEYTPMTAPYSAGGLYSTAEDLYRWDQALYGEAVLPEAARTLMFTSVLGDYGYGWGIYQPRGETRRAPPWAVPGHLTLVHPGSINGFSAEILRFPDDRATIIVLANIENISLGPDLAHIVFSGAPPR